MQSQGGSATSEEVSINTVPHVRFDARRPERLAEPLSRRVIRQGPHRFVMLLRMPGGRGKGGTSARLPRAVKTNRNEHSTHPTKLVTDEDDAGSRNREEVWATSQSVLCATHEVPRTRPIRVHCVCKSRLRAVQASFGVSAYLRLAPSYPTRRRLA